jgi:DNA helicase-2/ATP-dependent DNA helicase PcrA
MTLHAAKGLEFDNVFIVGLEDGLLPHERSCAGMDDLEEERRLFFVGMTRARERLTISYARCRMMRGQFIRSVPSQFLYEAGYAGREQSMPAADVVFEPDAAPDYSDEPGYERFLPREIVAHSKFGIGRVKEFLDLGQDSIVVVQFDSGKTKSLMLKYAGLIRHRK